MPDNRMVHLLTSSKAILMPYWLTSITYSDFNCTCCPFSAPGHHLIFISHCSSCVFGLWEILGLSSYFSNLDVLRSTGQLFVECPSNGICQMYALGLKWDYVLLVGRPQRQVILNTSYLGYVLFTWIITLNNGPPGWWFLHDQGTGFFFLVS